MSGEPDSPKSFAGEKTGDGFSSSSADEKPSSSIRTAPLRQHFAPPCGGPPSLGACIFLAEFASGYTFRQFVEFLKRVAKELPLAFSRHGISTAVCSSSRQITAHAVVRREDLTCFLVNESALNLPARSGDPAEWRHIVSVDTSELFDQVRLVAKKDSVRVFQTLAEPECIWVQVCRGTQCELAHSGAVRARVYTPVSYFITEDPRRATACPNATVQIARFCTALASLSKTRVEKVILQVYEDGALLVGVVAPGKSPHAPVTLGAAVPEGSVPQAAVVLSPQTIAALLKTSNLVADGVVRMYASGATLVRIEVAVGCYGSVRLYISEVARGRGASTTVKGSAAREERRAT